MNGRKCFYPFRSAFSIFKSTPKRALNVLKPELPNVQNFLSQFSGDPSILLKYSLTLMLFLDRLTFERVNLQFSLYSLLHALQTFVELSYEQVFTYIEIKTSNIYCQI
ncbi:hypothetical protein PRUPE_1G556100 [Prunus persica]|uniref:Uncharacterized protein n=1 Tax=Prunus persica TaxID=3760 RepID=A0A251RIN9_PRUPE|nr:hypothetical protein PRUPE_1G556100 [Prunus persica]